MNITRDVIQDLLPVYTAGEASADTVTLVEEYLKQDPELSANVGKLKEHPLPAAAPEFRSNEQATLLKTQRLLAWRTILLTVSLLLTFVPLSFAFSHGRVTWALWRDVSWLASALWTTAPWSWIGFFLIWRRLRATGL